MDSITKKAGQGESRFEISTDSMQQVMQHFQNTGAWNLPVIRDGKYFGFVSKSKLLTAYRRELINYSV